MTTKQKIKAINSLFLAVTAFFAPWLAYGQSPAANAQHNALAALRSQYDFFQSAVRSAPNYREQGYGNVQGQFQGLRDAYNGLKGTLTPPQLANGANSLAELDAGMDILQEAFTNFQNDLAAGRMPSQALLDMCQVLREGSRLWWDQFSRVRSQLRIGWG